MIKKYIEIFKRYLNPINYCRSKGVKIGNNTIVHPTIDIGSEPYLITIGDNSHISSRVSFVTHDGGGYRLLEEYIIYKTVEYIKEYKLVIMYS